MFALILLAGAILFLFRGVYIVKPGQRVVIWKRFGRETGFVRMLDSGVHFSNPFLWGCLGQGQFTGLVSNVPWYCVPIPGSSVLIDPPKIEIMSKDGVTGTADISLELELQNWVSNDVVGMNVPIKTKAFVTVNQWVSHQLGTLDAAELCSYSNVVSVLNNKKHLDLLNLDLTDCFLLAKRISVDPAGIRLHNEYSNTIGKEISNRRMITLNRLELDAEEETLQRKLKLSILQAQNECEMSKLRAQTDRVNEQVKADALASRAKALISVGLTSKHVADILVTEVAQIGVSRAEKVFIGLNPGIIGLKGVENVIHGYEQV